MKTTHTDTRQLSTVCPSGDRYEHRLLTPIESIPHYAHSEHLPVFFYGGWASSFAPYRFDAVMLTFAELGEVHFPTREHWFAAHKARTPEAALAIVNAGGPWDAKRAGRQTELVEDWDGPKAYNVMLYGLYIQLDLYPQLWELLDATGDRFIAELSPTDAIWGLYNPETDTYDGQNLLGGAWMQARKLLRESRS